MTVDGVAYPITLTPRGITRKTSDICDFPPLRVELTSAGTPGLAVRSSEQAEARHPLQATADFQQKVLLEYSAYRLFNLITPLQLPGAPRQYRLSRRQRPSLCFARRLLHRGFQRRRQRNGMDVAHMGARVPRRSSMPPGGAPLRRLRIYDQQLRLVDARRPRGRRLLPQRPAAGRGAGAPLMPIPYDFDFSGLSTRLTPARPKAFQSTTSGSAFIAAIAPTWRRRGSSPLNWPRAAQFIGVFTTIPAWTHATRRARRITPGFFSDLDSGKIFKTCIGS